jgi:hypothetical protein
VLGWIFSPSGSLRRNERTHPIATHRTRPAAERARTHVARGGGNAVGRRLECGRKGRSAMNNLENSQSQLRNFVIPPAHQPESRTVTARPRNHTYGFGASEPIPFPGADTIFSSLCGAISRRLGFCRGSLAPRSRRPKRLGSKDRGSARRSPPGRRRWNKYRTTTHSGKKFVERLGTYGQLCQIQSRFLESSKESLIRRDFDFYLPIYCKHFQNRCLHSPIPGPNRARPGSTAR